MIVAAVFAALLGSGAGGSMNALSAAMLASAKAAVELALSLIGPLCLWLGLMRIVERAGLLAAIARVSQPLLRRLFPSVPPDHPAFGAIVMNFAANFLNMDNAATAFGLRAMRALKSLSRTPGVATNAMVLFLAINAAGISAFPVNVIAARAALKPDTAGDIMLPTLIVSFLSLLTAIGWAKLFERFSKPPPETIAPEATGPIQEEPSVIEAPPPPPPARDRWIAAALGVALVALLVFRVVADVRGGLAIFSALRVAAGWVLPLLACAMVIYGYSRGVKVYEAAVEGARQGFEVFVSIVPFLVIILVAIGMIRASGVMDALTTLLTPVTEPLGMPAAVLPQALIRPLSGSAAMGVLVDTLKVYGPDSPEGFISSIIYGSSETTFYVLGVYFGAVGVRSLRHALAACLLADLSGMLIAVWVARLFL